MLEEMEEVVEGGGKENWAVPVEDMEDGTRKSEVGSLNNLGGPKLENRVDSEDDLKEGKGLGGWMVLEDMLAFHSEEGSKFGGKGEKVRAVESSVSKGGRDVRVLDGSEVPEPPEVKDRVWGRRIWEGEISRGRMRREEGRGAYCGARSKREGGNSSEDLLKCQTSSLCSKCRGLVPQRRGEL